MQALHCDGPDCEIWSGDEQLLADWLTVHDLAGTTWFHFHSGWCLTRWGANHFQPDMEVPNG